MDTGDDRRTIRWDGFHNARDLGGLPTAGGGVTRYGRLIRSADPRFITAAGWAAAQAAGVRLVIDLRNPEEVEPGAAPGAASLGAATFAVPAAGSVAPRPAGVQTVLIPLDDSADLVLWQRLRGEGLDGTALSCRSKRDHEELYVR